MSSLRIRALAGGVVALLVSVLGAAVAHADEADALIKRGVELRRAGNDRAALEQFRRAYDLSPSPRAVAQMGLAEQALGRWVDGEAHLAKALEAAQDPWIAKYRDTLLSSRGEIARHLGWLDITGGPAGAELRLDGQRVATSPVERPLRMPAGTFTLDALAQGHVFATRTVTVLPGETTREDLSPRAVAVAGPPPAQTEPAAPQVTARAVETRPPARAPGLDRQTAAWIAAGGAVVAAAAGGTLLYLGDRDANQFNTDCRVPSAGCDDLQSSGSHKQTAGVVGLVVAGALGVAAGVLFLAPSGHADGGRRVACAPTPTEPGAACAFRF